MRAEQRQHGPHHPGEVFLAGAAATGSVAAVHDVAAEHLHGAVHEHVTGAARSHGQARVHHRVEQPTGAEPRALVRGIDIERGGDFVDGRVADRRDAGELAWPLPLPEPYREYIDSLALAEERLLQP